MLNGNEAGSHDVHCSVISIFQGLFKIVIFSFSIDRLPRYFRDQNMCHSTVKVFSLKCQVLVFSYECRAFAKTGSSLSGQ